MRSVGALGSGARAKSSHRHANVLGARLITKSSHQLGHYAPHYASEKDPITCAQIHFGISYLRRRVSTPRVIKLAEVSTYTAETRSNRKRNNRAARAVSETASSKQSAVGSGSSEKS